MTYSSDNISVDELTGQGLLSVRAMNVCKRSRLFTFDAIYAHYQAHKTFMMLPHMGDKSNKSLVQLCSHNGTQLLQIKKTVIITPTKEASLLRQPYAVITAYHQIPEANRSAAEQAYGNLICTLHRRVIRALFILYKTKSLAGLINGLQVKPSAFAFLTTTFLQKETNLTLFLDELTRIISGDVLADTVKDYKLNAVVQQVAQLTRRADERMSSFLQENINKIATGDFPLSEFITLLIRCDGSLKSTYKNAALTSNLFYNEGLPPSKELLQKVGLGSIKFRRLYQDNGQHHFLYNQVSQGIKILQAHGLIMPPCYVFGDAAYHFFTNDVSAIKTVFTNRMLFPVLSCFNPAYRMFCRIQRENTCVLFVNKSIESWFDTSSFFAMTEKKMFSKVRSDDSYFFIQLLLPFCKHTPSEEEWQQLFAFTKPLLKRLHEQHLQIWKGKMHREISFMSRRQLICDFIKDKNRHCHVDEIAEHVAKNGELISRKTLLKYLEKCNGIIKPLDGHLFQLREWDTQAKWQQETVVQLAVNFLSAYNEPKHIYTIARYILKYKKVTLNVVADALQNNADMQFTIAEKCCFGIAGKAYEKPVAKSKKIPAYWLDTDPFIFFSEPQKGLLKEELVTFMTRRYKLTIVAARDMIAIRTSLGEWNESADGWLSLADKALVIAGNQQMQQAI